MSAAAVVKSVGERGVSIHGPIDDHVAHLCIAQLLYLRHSDSERPITLEIDSPGGQIAPSLAIAQVIDELSCPVHTFCSGHAGGTAVVILAHGARGFRATIPTATFSFAPVYADPAQGYVEAELSQFNQRLVELLAADCGKHEQEIRLLMQAHSELSASAALENGIVDSISDRPIIPSGRSSSGWRRRLWHFTRVTFGIFLPQRQRRKASDFPEKKRL